MNRDNAQATENQVIFDSPEQFPGISSREFPGDLSRPDTRVRLLPRSTPVPNWFFDQLLRLPGVTASDLRVLLIIWRQTVGWQKSSDCLSLTQLKTRARVSRGAAVGAIALWKTAGLIKTTKDDPRGMTRIFVIENAQPETAIPQLKQAIKERKWDRLLAGLDRETSPKCELVPKLDQVPNFSTRDLTNLAANGTKTAPTESKSQEKAKESEVVLAERQREQITPFNVEGETEVGHTSQGPRGLINPDRSGSLDGSRDSRSHSKLQQSSGKSSKPDPDPRHKRVAQVFETLFTTSNPNVSAPFDGSDGKQLQKMLREQPRASVEQITQWLRNAFESDNEFPLRRGFRFREFASHYTKYINGPLRKFTAPTRPSRNDKENCKFTDLPVIR